MSGGGVVRARSALHRVHLDARSPQSFVLTEKFETIFTASQDGLVKVPYRREPTYPVEDINPTGHKMVHKIFELLPHKNYTILQDSEVLPEKVWLYPEEGWARASCNSHWLLKTPWWSRRHCCILEVEGTKRHKTVGRVLPTREGEVVVEGTFRGITDGDFRLVLTSTLTPADQRRGYHMTGSLERGDRKIGRWQTTHLAVTKRSGFS